MMDARTQSPVTPLCPHRLTDSVPFAPRLAIAGKARSAKAGVCGMTTTRTGSSSVTASTMSSSVTAREHICTQLGRQRCAHAVRAWESLGDDVRGALGQASSQTEPEASTIRLASVLPKIQHLALD